MTPDEAVRLGGERLADVAALDDALSDLAKIDPQKASIVELRFFGGLTIEETAQCLGISDATVVRQWRGARAWLFRALSDDDDDPDSSR